MSQSSDQRFPPSRPAGALGRPDPMRAHGAEVYLFASAVDEAAVTIGDGNAGPLSDSTLGIAAETIGFCDDPSVDCSGCSVSPLMLPHGQPSAGLWMIGLVFAIVAGWRLRR